MMRSGSSHKRPRLRRALRWSLRALSAALALGLGLFAYLWLSTELPTPEQLRAHAALGSTRVLDRQGALLYELPDPLGARRQPVALAEVPPALRNATIAIEDRSFYSNPGIDLRGIGRALLDNLSRGSAGGGGSTITQQLARGTLLEPELAGQRSLERKLREIVLALKLTASYDKDEILALYLNQTYYGGMAYGVEAAARHYFGKPVRDLDLAESALLAGLPQAPTLYNPLLNLEAALARQQQVLDAMVAAGMITREQADSAAREPLQLKGEATGHAPHFVTHVLELLSAELGPEGVARGGLTITTTLDLSLQQAAEQTLRRQLELLEQPRQGGPRHNANNGAVVVLDPASGAILAMVGSPDFADSAIQGQFNAALAPRQPGSAIKPLTYAAALERGWTPATSILDVPSSFITREGDSYRPQNYDRAYHGPLALREALATSSNVAAVRTLEHIGVPALLEMAGRLGISTLGQEHGPYGLSLTLGGGEVTLVELAAAYAAFANGGSRVSSAAIVQVVDAGGAPLALRSPALLGAQPAQPAIDPSVAYLISDILSDRYARMRAFGARSVLDLDRPAAVKTGTTSNWRDNWTIGYTPDRVVGVWVGNADGQPMEWISGVSGAGPIWHDVMLAAHRDLPPRAFKRPPAIVELAICAEGGMLPGPNCPATRQERFIKGSQPRLADDTHISLLVDPELGCLASQGYPSGRAVSQLFRLLPAEAEPWAVAQGLPRPPRRHCGVAEQPDAALGAELLPPVTLPGGRQQPALLAPAPGARYVLSPDLPDGRQQLLLRARAGDAAASLTLLVDGQPIATLNAPPYQAFWPLSPGRHRASVVAEDQQGRRWSGPEVEFIVTE